jgi:hypothetical protein
LDRGDQFSKIEVRITDRESTPLTRIDESFKFDRLTGKIQSLSRVESVADEILVIPIPDVADQIKSELEKLFPSEKILITAKSFAASNGYLIRIRTEPDLGQTHLINERDQMIETLRSHPRVKSAQPNEIMKTL